MVEILNNTKWQPKSPLHRFQILSTSSIHLKQQLEFPKFWISQMLIKIAAIKWTPIPKSIIFQSSLVNLYLSSSPGIEWKLLRSVRSTTNRAAEKSVDVSCQSRITPMEIALSSSLLKSQKVLCLSKGNRRNESPLNSQYFGIKSCQ